MRFLRCLDYLRLEPSSPDIPAKCFMKVEQQQRWLWLETSGATA